MQEAYYHGIREMNPVSFIEYCQSIAGSRERKPVQLPVKPQKTEAKLTDLERKVLRMARWHIPIMGTASSTKISKALGITYYQASSIFEKLLENGFVQRDPNWRRMQEKYRSRPRRTLEEALQLLQENSGMKGHYLRKHGEYSRFLGHETLSQVIDDALLKTCLNYDPNKKASLLSFADRIVLKHVNKAAARQYKLRQETSIETDVSNGRSGKKKKLGELLESKDEREPELTPSYLDYISSLLDIHENGGLTERELLALFLKTHYQLTYADIGKALGKAERRPSPYDKTTIRYSYNSAIRKARQQAQRVA